MKVQKTVGFFYDGGDKLIVQDVNLHGYHIDYLKQFIKTNHVTNLSFTRCKSSELPRFVSVLETISVEALAFNFCQFSLDTLCVSIIKLPIQELRIESNWCDQDFIDNLSYILEHYTNIKRLKLFLAFIIDVNPYRLISSFGRNITHLWLNHTFFLKFDLYYLTKAIVTNKQLQFLLVHVDASDQKKWIDFCKAIENSTLSEIDIEFFSNLANLNILLHSVSCNKNIVSLSLWNSQPCVNQLQASIINPSISNLKRLSFSSVFVDGNIALEKTTRLRYLKIYTHFDNHSDDISAFFEKLKKNGGIVAGEISSSIGKLDRFKHLFNRNRRHFEDTKALCEILFAIRKYRRSFLQILCKDMTLLLIKHLMQTFMDYESFEE